MTRHANSAETARPASRLERLMERRVPLWSLLLTALLGLLVTIGFGALVLHAARGGQRWAAIQSLALSIAGGPDLIGQLWQGQNPYTATAVHDSAPPGFWRDPHFVDPGFLLVARYDGSRGRPTVRLIRLSDGKLLREYLPNLDALAREARRLAAPAIGNADLPFWVGHPDLWIGHPELIEDGGLIVSGTFLIARIDACGHTRWTLPGQHHSIERDADGQLWVPMILAQNDRPGATKKYWADALARLTPEGTITYSQPLSRIFDTNGLSAFYLGKEYSDDPFHLNDIEPVLRDGPYWRRGDVFISMRHQSMIALFRPATGKVIWWKSGPWLGQHDVDILDDHRISIFDNHVAFVRGGAEVMGHSRELIYDFENNTVSSPWGEAMAHLGIAVESGGRGTPLPGDDLFTEESNAGRILRIGAQGEVRWRFVNGDTQGRRYRLYWSRYLDPERYGKAIEAASGARCG